MNCYNGEKYLRESIDSVYAQTYENWEIIFWDNASTDKSAKIASSFNNKLKYYYGEVNLPLGAARNKALEQCNGEYIAFLDVDDLWLPHKLEKQITLFSKNPKVTLVYSDCVLINSDGKYVGMWTKQNKLYRGMVFKKLLVSGFIPLSTVVVQKFVFKEVGKFLHYKNAEEYDLFLKCAVRHPFDYVDESLAKYRIHESNYGRTHLDVALKEVIEIYDYWNKKLSLEDMAMNKIIKRGLSKSYYHIGRSLYFEEKNSSKARQYFLQALKHSFGCKPVIFILLSFINPSIILKIENNVKKFI